MIHDLNEVFEATINNMEAEGIDFMEEAAVFEIDYSPRPDLLITVTVVNKQVADLFEEAEGEMRGWIQ